MFVEESPEWRNWQTRWTQNPVVLSTVWVRPPPPGPSNKPPLEFERRLAILRCRIRIGKNLLPKFTQEAVVLTQQPSYHLLADGSKAQSRRVLEAYVEG